MSGKVGGDAGMIEVTGKAVVAAIVILLFLVVFFFCLHFYATWCCYHRSSISTATARRRRRRFDFAGGHQEITILSALRRGLDPSVLKTLPILVFDPEEFKDGLECAVCLCEVSHGEKARVLPKCNHGFHVDCIDMWFQSHSSCPLCRSPVTANHSLPNIGAESAPPLQTTLQASLPTAGDNSGTDFLAQEVPNFPTNVLVWGRETEVSTFGPSAEESHQENAAAEPSSSSSTDGVPSVIIDIQRQTNEDEEQNSSVPTRLRSLKRLLSGNRRVNPSSGRKMDQLEQGSS
ncbi:RING-H2 finger protein ATL3-like [Andrographis paniculata]|uniref:RING-H2 finger protein ATL3-like n=1 Tax=Andrographis paniculata TaxID=175694 RepID=UPI0021E75733|nr:RING-H2 finger protein ATL3-like [Andrographis paniculata]